MKNKVQLCVIYLTGVFIGFMLISAILLESVIGIILSIIGLFGGLIIFTLLDIPKEKDK